MKELYRKLFEWALWRFYADEDQSEHNEWIEGRIGPVKLISVWSFVLDAWVCTVRLGKLCVAVQGGEDQCYRGGIYLGR